MPRDRAKDAIDLDWLEQAAQQALDSNGPEPMAWALGLIRHIKGRLADIEAGLVQSIVQRVKSPDTIVGAWRIESWPGTDRKDWQSEQIVDRLLTITSVNADGELLPVEQWMGAFEKAIKTCVPLTKSLQWRTTGLRSYGLDPSEWCLELPGSPQVRVTQVAADG